MLLQATSAKKSAGETNGASSSRNLPKKAVKIYADYATRLWTETNQDARRRIAKDTTTSAVKKVENIMQGEEYVAYSEEAEEARVQLLSACQAMLKVMEKDQTNVTKDMKEGTSELTQEELVASEASVLESTAKPKKASRSVLFGAIMGAVVACWVFSGNYVFTGVFTLMTILGQLEYYRMVMNTGIYPARRISIVGACSMFLTVCLRLLSKIACCNIFFILVSQIRHLFHERLSLLHIYTRYAFLCSVSGQ